MDRNDQKLLGDSGLSRRVVAAAPPELSRLQVTLLAQYASGESVKSAAFRLQVTYPTAWGSINRAKQALGSRTIAQACIIAMLCGYVSQPTGADMRCVPLAWAE